MSPQVPSSAATLPFADLDVGALADLIPRVRFRKGTEIGVQGGPCEGVYLVQRGRVMLSCRNYHGESLALYVLTPGELFGEESLRPERQWLVTVRALTEGAARVIPAAQFSRVAQHSPDLMVRIVSLLAGRLERMHRRMGLITTSTARERVLGFLTLMAEYDGQRHEDGVWLPLSLTQAEMGEMLGLARETVARVMNSLETEGVIRRTARRGLWVRLSDDAGPS
jgi:CRP-like cAMP-binding protein